MIFFYTLLFIFSSFACCGENYSALLEKTPQQNKSYCISVWGNRIIQDIKQSTKIEEKHFIYLVQLFSHFVALHLSLETEEEVSVSFEKAFLSLGSSIKAYDKILNGSNIPEWYSYLRDSKWITAAKIMSHMKFESIDIRYKEQVAADKEKIFQTIESLKQEIKDNAFYKQVGSDSDIERSSLAIQLFDAISSVIVSDRN